MYIVFLKRCWLGIIIIIVFWLNFMIILFYINVIYKWELKCYLLSVFKIRDC